MAYNNPSSSGSDGSSATSLFNYAYRPAETSSSQTLPHEEYRQAFGNGKAILSTTHVQSHDAGLPNIHDFNDFGDNHPADYDTFTTSPQRQLNPMPSLSSSEITKTALLPAARRRSVRHANQEPAGQPAAEMLTLSTFLLALSNPPVRYRLQEFCREGTCCDYISFLDQVQTHRRLVEESSNAMAAIDQMFLSPHSPDHIDLSTRVSSELRGDIASVTSDTLPGIAGIFDEAEAAVQAAIYKAFYPDFVRAQLMISTTEAMGSNVRRFKGLGDCFSLTDPSKADNPILFASDGFVSVTGYNRQEIIPRNCRFLQGPGTDSAAVQRVKQAVRDQRESVEFLLNYRKNGEPFWNLLYTAPLYDADNRLAFFIGGQVNCSSAIHGKQDIMKILATAAYDPLEYAARPDTAKSPTSGLKKRVEQVKSLQYRHEARVAAEPGIESILAEVTRGATVVERVTSFQSAYSKYFVADYPTLTIRFSSPDMRHLLSLPNSSTTTLPSIIGSNAFSYLKTHMLIREKSPWKSRVETALKHGEAISVALDLQTRRSVMFRGDERLMVHWTPLKDGRGEVGWVVVCLSPMMG